MEDNREAFYWTMIADLCHAFKDGQINADDFFTALFRIPNATAQKLWERLFDKNYDGIDRVAEFLANYESLYGEYSAPVRPITVLNTAQSTRPPFNA